MTPAETTGRGRPAGVSLRRPRKSSLQNFRGDFCKEGRREAGTRCPRRRREGEVTDGQETRDADGQVLEEEWRRKRWGKAVSKGPSEVERSGREPETEHREERESNARQRIAGTTGECACLCVRMCV